MTEDVVQRLLRHGLVLVHGSSGSGKSSLVYAGVSRPVFGTSVPYAAYAARNPDRAPEDLSVILSGLSAWQITSPKSARRRPSRRQRRTSTDLQDSQVSRRSKANETFFAS
jgi:hypothetical protein